MDLNWLQSIVFGFLSGFADIVPVSAQAHRVLLLKFFGIKGSSVLFDLLIHLGNFAALYYSCQAQMVRMSRARALSRIPKRKRKRPLDVHSLMDLSLLKTMLVPAILGIFLYQYTVNIRSNLIFIAIFLFVNGIILYVPQFLPTGNRDSRTLSRVEGLLMGLGSTASILPGVSAIGVTASVASVCGVEKDFSLNMAFLMNLFIMAGYIVYDVMAIISAGMDTLTFAIFIRYLLTALCAFGGTLLGIKFLRQIASNHGYSLFGLYCIGLSLFTFILNLMA